MPKPPKRLTHDALVLTETLFTTCQASTLPYQEQFAAIEMLLSLLNLTFADEIEDHARALKDDD